MPVANDPVDATKISGGVSKPVDGSGKVELTPTAVEAGSRHVDIKLTYTAETNLKNKWLIIRPKGVVIDTTREDMRLQNTNSAGYGYISSSMPGINVAGDLIRYPIDDLDKNKSVTIAIHRVDIVSEAREYPWEVFMGDTPFSATRVESPPPILSVTNTSGKAVDFEIVGDSTFPAGSMATIMFRFSATSTAIRNGSVSLTIPAALGSKPSITQETPGRVMVEHSEGKDKLEMDQDTKPGISNRTINVGVKRMDVGESITITYGSSRDQGKPAVLSDVSGNVTVVGTFKTSAGVSARRAGTVTVTIGNIVDGLGSVQIPVGQRSVEAGSNHRTVEIEFVAVGTMDGGQVSLEMPAGWGSLQEDPTLRNYVTTRGLGVSALDISGNRVIATLGQFAKGDSFRFIIGGGTGGDNNGIEVQDSVGTTAFGIRSDGDGDNVFAPITSELEHKGREQLRNPKALGKIYKISANEDITVGAGVLRIEAISALDGTGTATVDTTEVRAAADDVALEFTYTPSQTIENGELRFTVPSSWSKPRVKEPGLPGYTEVESVGLGAVTVNDKFTVIIPIVSLYKGQIITIKYGATATGRAMASTVVGPDAFKFEMRGHADGTLTPLRTQPTVMVGPQSNGKGKAVLAITDDGGDLHAGDMGREITITYTAAGQMVAGDVVFGIPARWSAPTVDNLMVTPDITPTIDGQVATVSGVNLMAGGQVTLVYTGDVQPTIGTGVAFSVKVSGGAEGDAPVAVSGEETMLTVDVGQARAGSGMGTISPRIVEAGATGANIQLTYTAAGWTDAPREFRVQVPRGWTAPSNAVSSADNKGTYTVKHRSDGAVTLTSVEKLDPIGRDMVARVRLGGLEVEAGDEIIFTYENADAPATPEVSNFVMIFDGKPIADSVQVRVQDSIPSQLSLESAGTVSADEGAPPLGITIGLRDTDGNAVAMENDVAVALTSSSSTGAFSMMADEAGTESATVTIAGGDVSAIVYYTDSTVGTVTINASAPGLMAAIPHEVTVTTAAAAPDAVAITSVTVDPTLAKDGDTVTVTAMATAGQAPMVTIGTLVTDGAMVESPSGTYTRSDTLAAGTQEGTHRVSVSIGDVMMAASDVLTVDNTAPAVTVTAPESAENGDTVMISATVTDAGDIASVMADVSALDSTQTDMVALGMAADGSYSASVTISADNAAANGAKTIAVKAMDAAGNSDLGTATVQLANMLSYTSTIPVGMVLFHVPLDVDGLDTVRDLKAALGDAVSVAAVYNTAAGSWNNESDNVVITADLGILLLTTTEITHTFKGQPWGGGLSTINLQAGSNFIGLPVDDPRIMNVSDIITVAAGAIAGITVATDDGFAIVGRAGDPGDGPVMGDAAYLVTATADGIVTLIGDGWSNDGAKTITVTAMDAADNSGMGTATVELANMLSYTSMIPVGQSLFHVPLEVEGLDSVGDLKAALGDSVSIAAVYDPTLPDPWNSKSDDVAITADLGILLLTTAEITHTFKGQPWGGGPSTIKLQAGSNFIGLPVDDPRIMNVSDIITVAAGAIAGIGVLSDDGFTTVGRAGDPGDGPVMGDAAYLVTATSTTTVPLLGEGWSYGMAGAAPIALTGYSVDGQTAILDVSGAVVDEITGLARGGFRVKVKNLSTQASLSKVTSVETAVRSETREGYNMTFVDLKAGHAARIGDVLEISADSPSPLIGVKPVRHVVTADDVKSGILALENLIAYEIPAETELLRNYPNPFNPETWIPYRLAEDADVSLTIYDVNGATGPHDRCGTSKCGSL